MNKATVVYRIAFYMDDEVYEICARTLHESAIFGFLEIGDLVFTEHPIVVDTAQERLQQEFRDVRRMYVPVHSIIRIDELNEAVSMPKIKPLRQGNIARFPGGRVHSPDKTLS